jgi:ubiquinone/menaquinone biosynthesis C-methylase UbiE
MTGVKLGDRVLFAGTDDIRLVTELATRAGLSGRVVLIAPDDRAARARAERVEQGGGLVEPRGGALDALSLEDGGFDVAVTEETLMALDDPHRVEAIAALFRALRPGGRLLWIERHGRGGLFAKPAPDTSSREQTLTAAGFRGVRTLAAAEGRTYVEGIKSA